MTDQVNLDCKPQPIGFGIRLKNARENLRLSPKDAADRLHLNSRIIHRIENEDFENSPPPIFMRGYLRSYARLLSFPEQEINAALEALNLSIQTSFSVPAKTTTRTKQIHERYTHWATYLVIGISAVLVGVWWTSHSTNNTDPFPPNLAQQTHTVIVPTETKNDSPATTLLATNTPKDMPVTIASAPNAPINLTKPDIVIPQEPVKIKNEQLASVKKSNTLPAFDHFAMSVPEPELDIDD